MNINNILLGYLVCALWSSTDDAGTPYDRQYTLDDFSLEFKARALADCEAFTRQNAALLEGWESAQIGHSFWLSRNGHGAGFFDFPRMNGDALQDAARAYGEIDLYITDDGELTC
jgi:hypothetical protein